MDTPWPGPGVSKARGLRYSLSPSPVGGGVWPDWGTATGPGSQITPAGCTPPTCPDPRGRSETTLRWRREEPAPSDTCPPGTADGASRAVCWGSAPLRAAGSQKNSRAPKRCSPMMPITTGRSRGLGGQALERMFLPVWLGWGPTRGLPEDTLHRGWPVPPTGLRTERGRPGCMRAPPPEQSTRPSGQFCLYPSRARNPTSSPLLVRAGPSRALQVPGEGGLGSSLWVPPRLKLECRAALHPTPSLMVQFWGSQIPDQPPPPLLEGSECGRSKASWAPGQWG